MSKAIEKKENKKSKRKIEEEALSEYRRREGFLPYYADVFFDGIRNFGSTFWIWAVIVIAFFEMVLFGDENVLAVYAVTACLFVAIYKLWREAEKRMKRFGYQLEEDALVKMAWGQRQVIPYQDIQSALMTMPIRMTIKELMVPSLYGYIRFPYEVGNAKQQKHILECYTALKDKVQYDMPAMTVKNISYFDRMYTYNKTFRNCCIGLCFIELWIFGSNIIQYEGSYMLMIHTASMVVQCGVLAKMAKSIRLGLRNAKELQHKLTQYPSVTYKIKYHKIWQFIITAIVVISLNALIVWYCQRVYL